LILKENQVFKNREANPIRAPMLRMVWDSAACGGYAFPKQKH